MYPKRERDTDVFPGLVSERFHCMFVCFRSQIRLQEENKSSANIDPWYSTYHHTHPPLVERLKAIENRKEE